MADGWDMLNQVCYSGIGNVNVVQRRIDDILHKHFFVLLHCFMHVRWYLSRSWLSTGAQQIGAHVHTAYAHSCAHAGASTDTEKHKHT